MKEPTNRTRADWARIGVDAFADEVRMQDEELEFIVSDFLCDLMHLCRLEDVDWKTVMSRAEMHYREELQEEASGRT